MDQRRERLPALPLRCTDAHADHHQRPRGQCQRWFKPSRPRLRPQPGRQATLHDGRCAHLRHLLCWQLRHRGCHQCHERCHHPSPRPLRCLQGEGQRKLFRLGNSRRGRAQDRRRRQRQRQGGLRLADHLGHGNETLGWLCALRNQGYETHPQGLHRGRWLVRRKSDRHRV